MRILLDYRPALRERTGVGEYAHELARALVATGGGHAVSLFTSSWKDRPSPQVAAEFPRERVIDRRVPVRALTWAWHHLEWPPVEWLAGRHDVVHAQTPTLIPSRAAAQVVTIHDLDFLKHPERAEAEMRHDYPRLVAAHARRADGVIVSSHYAAREVASELGLSADRIAVCSPGAPAWAAAIADERRQRRHTSGAGIEHEGCILFIGTLERRKNIAGLLDGYARLRSLRPDAPPLVLAGRLRDAAALGRLAESPLAAHVRTLGYVTHLQRLDLYRAARMLVLPSLEEGFGLPVLEAMACGVPVVISDRGSLPEVAGPAAAPVPPTDADALAREMARLLDPEAALAASTRGLERAATYSWGACAAAALDAYGRAIERRRSRG